MRVKSTVKICLLFYDFLKPKISDITDEHSMEIKCTNSCKPRISESLFLLQRILLKFSLWTYIILFF